MIKSAINPVLTLDYILSSPENKYFDVKSAAIKPSDIYGIICAFANAEGGTLVLGVEDKNRIVEGINSVGNNKINEFINAPKNGCKPMPVYDTEFMDVTNSKGEQDRLLLIHIKASVDQIIRTSNDSTYLRIGDKTREIKGDDLRNLEYSKSTRHYEDECNMDAKIADLDEALLAEYKKILGAENLPTEQVLRARGFIKESNGKQCLTNAAVLLFARNINQFYPNCRIRFIRYDGEVAKVGKDINIIKDITIEQPILRIIEKAKEFIATQLREFTALNLKTGKFEIVPEYPEFAWLEGIVNAVTHREYGLTGSYILVSMYDDRLEIKSPGKLPNIVTVDNIKETRYSRNPRIARVLTDFGWVRELNEGVKRIYSDMKDLFLEEPLYSEPEQYVKLVLKNNIAIRSVRVTEKMQNNIGTDIWNSLDDTTKEILAYMSSRQCVSRPELERYTGKSSGTVTNRLKRLIELNLIKRNGLQYDPNQTYSIDVK
jgi:ATP-dependent DNA helicase RecG